MLIRTLKDQKAGFSRAVGLLLVVFILYGTTVEAAHRHGRVLPTQNGVASVVDPAQEKNLTSSNIGCSDCLICQLHQNFSTTLISFRESNQPLHVRTQSSDSALVIFHSLRNAPRTGRGPPLSSLL